jgi:isopenicillin-N N-acyltransferase like protein
MSETKGKRKLKIVEAGGSHYEMGLQYGTACPEIRRMLEMTQQLFGGADKARAVVNKYAPGYLASAQKYAPEIVEEMKGMAEGAKVAFEDILFLNITYEISTPDIMSGCTSFAASGEATKTGGVIAGQNFDFIEQWDEFMVLLKMKPDNGPKFMAVTAAGCLGLIGLNSAGLSVNLNLLKNKDSMTPTGGTPTHVILRKVFMSRNISEAITAIAAAEGRAAKNYLVTSGEGDITGIETTTNDMDVQYPVRGIYTHANCFKADRFKSADMAPLFSADSYIRAPRLNRLMENQHGKLTAEAMKDLLADHNNHPGSICRHPNPNAPLWIAKMAKTLVSIITLPAERKTFISYGNPCENEYIEYQL